MAYKTIQEALTKAGELPDAALIPSQVGRVDFLTDKSIVGWAWDPDRPNEPISVEVLDGDKVILTLMADMYRADLVSAGVGDGRHGFQIESLRGFLPSSRHFIRVRRAFDGMDLSGLSGWIVREDANFDDVTAEYIENIARTSIATAQNPDDLGHPLSVLLGAVNQLVNARLLLEPVKPLAARKLIDEISYLKSVTDETRDLILRISDTYKPIYFPECENPTVSIIVPAYNKFQYTYNCLKSISENMPNCTFEIIIVDDCSRDETIFSTFVFSGAVRVSRNPRNLGFVGGCNSGASQAKGKYLFFLNNDTLVRPGWLDNLVETFDSVPNIGIAGSKLLFEDLTLQEAGGIIWRLGDGWNWGRGRNATEPAFCYLRDSDWVSGAALMIEADMFRQFNGFDTYYAPAYYEDTDLAFRVRAAGKRVVVQPASQIVHLEGISAGTDTGGTGMKRFQLINHRKFYERWKTTLAQHRFNAQQPELEAERNVKLRAFFIDDSVPTPDKDAGSNAALQHMIALMALGYKVTFLPADNMAKIDPYTENLQKLGIECLYAPFYWSVEEVYRKTQIAPDVVYLHRYINASKYANLTRRYFPKAKIIYNVADLHYIRAERQAVIEGSLAATAEAENLKRSELATMYDVDSIIVHSSFEADTLKNVDAKLPVTVVPWTVKLRPTPLPFKQRDGFAFVGSFGHPPNLDAALYLAAEIMPKIRKSRPGATAYIVGSNVPAQVTALQSADFNVMGYVPELADALHRVRCTIVPLRYGAGLKGKVLESFAHGIPCVMSEIAAEGMDLPAELQWLIAKTPDDFAKKLALMLANEEKNAEFADLGLEFISKIFSALAIERGINAAIQRSNT